MPTFDLLSEPWIPVLDTFDGDDGVDLRATPDAPLRLREVGLREALLRAHQIREVYCDSPLETIALNRLLLALALDVYQSEPDEDAWRALWQAGAFPVEPLDDYLRPWGDRFDLLHAEHPFYQRATPDASKEGKEPTPLAKLFLEEASDNQSGTLFSHHLTDPPRQNGEPPRQMPLALAARGVVVGQAYQFGGGVSFPIRFADAVLVGKAQFWIRGQSLFEALLLNGPPLDEARMGATGFDAPVWRRALDDDHEYERRTHEGLLDVLTWPSRRLTLVTETTDGETVATGVYLTQGDKLDPQPEDDPLAAHVMSDKKGIFPFGLRTDRAVWRDASVLFSTTETDGSGAPWTFKWATALAAPDDELARVFREEGVDVFGLVNDQAKAELWRHERLPLHVPILADPARQSVVKTALEHARNVLAGWKEHRIVWGLRPALRTTAAYALSPPAPGDDAFPSADPKEVANLTQSLAAEPRYWGLLEPRFFAFLRQLAEADDEDARSAVLAAWTREVSNAAEEAFDAATASFDGDARHLRATAEGRARLRPSVQTPAS